VQNITILILQDRSIGLEALQPDLRRDQLFTFFAHATSEEELRSYLDKNTPDVIILVREYFPLNFESIQKQLLQRGLHIPIIVMASSSKSEEAMNYLRQGAADFLLTTELHRVAPTLYKLLSTSRNGHEKPAVRSPEPRIEELMDVVTEIDVSGSILYESPSIKPILGYETDELIGRNAFSLVHPLDLPKIMPIFMVALATPGVPHSARFRFKHRDGKWRTLETVGKTMATPEGGRRIVLTSRDITNRDRTIALGNAESRFMGVVEGLGEGILITDLSDKIFYANRRMGELIGRDIAELLGKVGYKELFEDADWGGFIQDKQIWMSGERVVKEYAIKQMSGSLLPTQVTISAYRSMEGQIAGMLAAFTDVSHIRQAEADLQRAFHQLREAKERAEEMSRLKTSFLANISHEIRTPMTAMLGFSQMLSERLSNSELATYADSIHNSGVRLLGTLNGILEFARIESNRVQLVPTKIDIKREIDNICALLRKEVSSKGLSLRVEVPYDQSITVDAYYFARIMSNLIENAVKFTVKGGVVISSKFSDETVTIEVKDTGIGISPEFLPHVFDEFQQESTGLARAHEGAGLGLTISKRLTELMGGSLTVQSVVGEGSVFTVQMPR